MAYIVKNILKYNFIKHRKSFFEKICSHYTSFSNERSSILLLNFQKLLNKSQLKQRYLSDKRFRNDVDHNEYEDEVDDHVVDNTLIRNLLYANSKDPLIQLLNECASVQNVFNIIRKHNEQMNPMHIAQAVLVLWDLQKIYYDHNIHYENDNNSNSLLSANALLQNYVNQVNSHEDFEILIRLIEQNHNKFCLEDLTCVLLYLNRMGVRIHSNVMQLMIMRMENEIKNCDLNKFPLTCLSRFIVTMFTQDCLYSVLVSICAFPIISHRLQTCETDEEFKLISICLIKMKQLLAHEDVITYKRICDKFIKNKLITKENPRTILKAIRFLNYAQRFENNTDLINSFIHILKGSINKLTARELITLYKVFQMQSEPGDMLEEIQNHASNLITENSSESSLNLLECIISFASPLHRPKYNKYIQQYLKNHPNEFSVPPMYKIIYYVKSTDEKFYNYFWDSYLELILHQPNRKLEDILKLCYRYTHFSQNVGLHYRNINFEQTVVNCLNSELNNNLFSFVPAKFARIASFIIAYSQDLNYVEKILDHLIEMSGKFEPVDILSVSTGIQILLENKNRNIENISNKVQLLHKLLNESTKNKIAGGCNLSNVTLLLRGYTSRRGSIDDDLFQNLLLNQYKIPSDGLTSNIIRNLMHCLQINNYLDPDIMNTVADYVINKNEQILGNVVDKILHFCYSSGFTPDNHEDFLNAASDIIIRDKNRFGGLTIIQICLALCYYHKLPDALIKHIFSVEFLEKLDEEMSNCYAKSVYPGKVRNYLMQLNRAVCLDYPEANVPWFHQKYIDNINKHEKQRSFFHKEVFSLLIDLLKDTNYLINENVISPYGYYLDFELKSNDNELSKIGVLLLKTEAFTKLTPNLKGHHQLKRRHLELLGYDVIHITSSEWNSFYVTQNCKEFLSNKISSKLKLKSVL